MRANIDCVSFQFSFQFCILYSNVVERVSLLRLSNWRFVNATSYVLHIELTPGRNSGLWPFDLLNHVNVLETYFSFFFIKLDWYFFFFFLIFHSVKYSFFFNDIKSKVIIILLEWMARPFLRLLGGRPYFRLRGYFLVFLLHLTLLIITNFL